VTAVEQLWIFGIFIAIVIVGIIVAYYAAERRRKELADLAQRIGFDFDPNSDEAEGAYASYGGFAPFGRGGSRKSYNLLRGTRGQIAFELFDYRFTTGSGKNKQTHRYGIVAARAPMHFHELQIRPEGFFDKLASFAGFDDINFESNEFSARYHVSCADRQFAYAIIHPQMIEFLLACPPHHWQLNGGVILIHRRGRFSPSELRHIISVIEKFVALIPPFVREDIGHAGPDPRLR
jgi:hypothetical protein